MTLEEAFIKWSTIIPTERVDLRKYIKERIKIYHSFRRIDHTDSTSEYYYVEWFQQQVITPPIDYKMENLLLSIFELLMYCSDSDRFRLYFIPEFHQLLKLVESFHDKHPRFHHEIEKCHPSKNLTFFTFE